MRLLLCLKLIVEFFIILPFLNGQDRFDLFSQALVIEIGGQDR